MPHVWINNVEAPSYVPKNTPFQIKWEIKYRGWPLKNLYSEITWDSNKIRKEYKAGCFCDNEKITVQISGINKKTVFLISAGWFK